MRTYSARVAQRHAPGADEVRDWRTDAACADHDPELFFGLTAEAVAEAVAVCQGCPVRERCGRWADDMGLIYGVWGGETEDQRRARLAGRPQTAGQVAICDQCRRGYVRRRPEQRFCSPTCHHDAMAASRTGVARPGAASCGTAAAARRHRKHGEPVDAACRMAESLYRARRRAQAARETAGVGS